MDQAVLRLNLPPAAMAALGGAKVMDIQLLPLREAYFDRNVVVDAHTLGVDRGDREVVAGLMAIGVLILVLAAINYVNLATIRVIRRQREIGMRKVLGFGNGRLAFQFLAESMLVSLLATVIGLALAVLALPGFAALANRDLSGMLSLANIAAALGVGVIVGPRGLYLPGVDRVSRAPGAGAGRPAGYGVSARAAPAPGLVRAAGRRRHGTRQLHAGRGLANAFRHQWFAGVRSRAAAGVRDERRPQARSGRHHARLSRGAQAATGGGRRRDFRRCDRPQAQPLEPGVQARGWAARHVRGEGDQSAVLRGIRHPARRGQVV